MDRMKTFFVSMVGHWHNFNVPKLMRPSSHRLLRQMCLFEAALLAVFFSNYAVAGTVGGPSSKAFTVSVKAINTLGLDLLCKAAYENGNIVFSPYSIQLALAMTYAGSAGETRKEMAQTLHYPEDERRLQASFATLSGELGKISGSTKKQRLPPPDWQHHDPGPVVLKVANRLFGQERFPFLAHFLKTLSDGYHAPMGMVNFIENAAAVTLEINRWVENSTEKHIVNLIPKGTLDGKARLVIVNAVYFKAPWKKKFNASDTLARPFYLSDKKPVDVMTMMVESKIGYRQYDGFTAITIPYSNEALQFFILLPNNSKKSVSLESWLTSEQLTSLASTPVSPVILYLPKFRIDPALFAIEGFLHSLGMKSLFNSTADFSLMAKSDVMISNVFHKAFTSVDEIGTEAAATTGLVARGISEEESPSVPPKVVHINRPFLFGIQHRPSGACLFLGRVADPR